MPAAFEGYQTHSVDRGVLISTGAGMCCDMLHCFSAAAVVAVAVAFGLV